MYSLDRYYGELMTTLNNKIINRENFNISLIDIDNFHSGDDRWSNEEKNQFLFNLLKVEFPETFYLGKDEFSVISPTLGLEESLTKLTHIKKSYLKQYNLTFSAAIGYYTNDGEDQFDLLRSLEDTLFTSKKIGKNKIEIVRDSKMKLKSNYYTPGQLNRLSVLAKQLKRSEASLLREALDRLIRLYEN